MIVCSSVKTNTSTAVATRQTGMCLYQIFLVTDEKAMLEKYDGKMEQIEEDAIEIF